MIQRIFVFSLGILISLGSLIAQTTISGQIKDDSGYEVEYASVYLSDRSTSTNSDASGNYSLTCTNCSSDTIVFASLGYKTKKLTYIRGIKQTIDVTLKEDVIELEKVVIAKIENPAFAIMRKVVDSKKTNDIRSLQAYQYESYNRIELDINNISEEFMKKKILNKLNTSLEELQKLTDEEGRQYFPVFISETMSDYHYKKRPSSTKEVIKATKMSGIGMTDGSFTSQLVGASFAQFNFYKNSLTVLEKEIISPIADGWRLYYDYELIDSLELNGRFCYELEIEPKNSNLVAFNGTIWVDKSSYALLKIDLKIPGSANINYIQSIEVKREWMPTETGSFFPRRTEIIIDANEVKDEWASMMVKSTFTVDSLIVNKPYENKFYEFPIEVNENAQDFDNEYWSRNRHDTLSQHEQDAFALVDTIKNLPVVKSYIDIFNILFNGYKDIGKVAIGPYISAYAYNNIERHRFRIGFKTNIDFSKKMFFQGYLAYGTADAVLKHNLQGKFILKRKPYIETGFQWRKDLDQLGLEAVTYNNVFDSFSRWGELRAPYYNHLGQIYIFKQLNKHFSSKVSLRNRYIEPQFDFGYFRNGTTDIQKNLRTTEVEFKLRFAHNESFLQTDYGRQSLGSKNPEIEITYITAIKDALNSNFNYQKIAARIDHRIGMGILGRAVMRAQVGKIFGNVPYPLLNTHLGNQTPLYIYSGYNMMNYFEFISDQYVEAKYVHHFDGFFLDRVPLMRRLKWRTVANVSALWGSVKQDNFDILEPNSRIFGTFNNYPYLEVGYGVENIFKIIRVQMFQRITYLDRPDANRFGLKATLQFQL